MTVLPETLPELDFAVEDAKVVRYAASPTIAFPLRVERAGGGPVSSVVLQVQIRIAATRRAYDEDERGRLGEVFGRPAQWGRSVRSLLWTNVTAVVPPFEHATVLDLPVGVTYDFEVAASQYLRALAGGEAPLEFLFSGTVFYPDDAGRLRTALISWEKEARFAMPASLWHEAIEEHFPGTAWLRVQRRTFDRLHSYRTREALPTWELALESLLDRADES